MAPNLPHERPIAQALPCLNVDRLISPRGDVSHVSDEVNPQAPHDICKIPTLRQLPQVLRLADQQLLVVGLDHRGLPSEKCSAQISTCETG